MLLLRNNGAIKVKDKTLASDIFEKIELRFLIKSWIT